MSISLRYIEERRLRGRIRVSRMSVIECEVVPIGAAISRLDYWQQRGSGVRGSNALACGVVAIVKYSECKVKILDTI